MTTQANYDKAVAKYGKTITDSYMKEKGYTIDTPTKEPVKAIEYTTVSDPITHQETTVKTGSDEHNKITDKYEKKQADAQAALDKQAAERRAAKRRAAKLKKQYESVSKKAGGAGNLLKVAAKKYGVNSPQYKAIKKKVTFYEKPVSTVKTNVTEKETTPINTKKGLQESQYNTLLKKYGDAAGVIAATKNKYGTNSTQAKKMADLLENYSGVKANQNIRENTSTVTDSNLKDTGDSLKGLNPGELDEKTVFGYKWNSPERQAIAKQFGIESYTGTATQNALLKSKLKTARDTEMAAKKEETTKTTKKEEEVEIKKDDTLSENQEVKTTSDKITANKKNLDALKKLRLEGRTDEDLLSKAEGKFGKESAEYEKLKVFMKENPLADSTEGIDSDLLDKSKEEINETQIDSLEAAKDENIAQTAENFIKGSELISENNEELQTFYKNMAVELKTFIEENKERRVIALQRTKDSELNRVVGQIRATLARRGVQLGNIAPEQLIAMSGELGVEAMRKINEATTEMEDAVAEMTESKMAEINSLVEQGLIKQNEADLSIEQMRQLKEKMISDIKSNFVANTFKVTQASIADSDTNKAQVLNAVSQFVTELGISGTAQGVMEDYIDAGDSVEALKNMVADLNDANSELFKAVNDAAKAAQLSAQFEAKIKLMNATKTPSSSSTSTSTKSELSSSQRSVLVNNGYDPNSYPTYASVIALANQDKALKLALSKAAITLSE